MKPSILLTGASGFIGKPLMRALVANGYVVDPLRCRLHDEAALAVACQGKTMVIHCAGEIRNRAKMIDTNVRGTNNMGTTAALEGVRIFVHIGTASTRTHTDYGQSKARAEEIILAIGKSSAHMRVVIVRPPTLYGGTRGPKWWQGLKLLLMGRPLRLQSREQCVAEIMRAAGL